MPYTKDGIGHVDFDTSEASAARMPEFDVSLRGKIVALIRAAGADGLTCEQVEIALDARHQTVSSAIRRCVLRAPSTLVDSGKRRRNTSGRFAAVWVVPEHVPADAVVINLRDRLRARRKR